MECPCADIHHKTLSLAPTEAPNTSIPIAPLVPVAHVTQRVTTTYESAPLVPVSHVTQSVTTIPCGIGCLINVDFTSRSTVVTRSTVLTNHSFRVSTNAIISLSYLQLSAYSITSALGDGANDSLVGDCSTTTGTPVVLDSTYTIALTQKLRTSDLTLLAASVAPRLLGLDQCFTEAVQVGISTTAIIILPSTKVSVTPPVESTIAAPTSATSSSPDAHHGISREAKIVFSVVLPVVALVAIFTAVQLIRRKRRTARAKAQQMIPSSLDEETEPSDPSYAKPELDAEQS